MILFLDGEEKKKLGGLPDEAAQLVCFVPTDEAHQALKELHMQKLLLPRRAEGESSRFESHPGFDCISLHIPNKLDMEAPFIHIDVFLTGNDLVFVYEPHPAIEALIAQLRQRQQAPLSPERVLYLFFNLLTENDSAFLQDIEEDIGALEDTLADEDSEVNYPAEVSLLRKKLLQWKRYYESLFDLLVDLEENQNQFLSKEQLSYFHILTNRADRLYHSVLNLRDYVTQVRESYQAQLDISMNKTMKLFTVVSTIFLPLSLIAGWYGMNLRMPEFEWHYGYPLVIALSAIVVIGCIWYFKKHKWF